MKQLLTIYKFATVSIICILGSLQKPEMSKIKLTNPKKQRFHFLKIMIFELFWFL